MFEVTLKKDAVKKALKEKGMSISEFAKETSLGRTHVSQVLNNKKKPSNAFIAGALAILTDCKFEQLFFLDQAFTNVNEIK